MEFLQNNVFWLVILAVAAIGGIAYYLSWLRRKKLGELASSMGLLFSEEGPDQAFLEGTGLEIFCSGHSRKASNMIQVSSPAGELRFFDYRYSTGHGKHRHTHHFTLALVKCAIQVPDFELKPETLMYKLGEAIGFKDIDLPAFPVFSDKYRLTGADETAVHMFFTPERAAWFERNPGLRLQGGRNSIVFFKRDGNLPADAWQGFMEEVKAFAAEVLK